MDKKPSIVDAIKVVCEEKGLALEVVVETVEAALAAAYRKDFGQPNQNIKVNFDLADGSFSVCDLKEVAEDPIVEEESEETVVENKVEDKKVDKATKEPSNLETLEDQEEPPKRFNPKTQISITEALKIKKSYKIGDIIKTELEVHDDFGRMAAQTAKQVIIQKLREAERTTIFDEFKDKEGEIVVGVVQRCEPRIILVDLGKTVGIIPRDEQVFQEEYEPGERIKVYIKSVGMGNKGPEIILSRSDALFVKRLFELEIPEISNGLIEVKSVVREAGARTKIAVQSLKDDIDPIGSCVGQRGARVQTIINEINGEKIDIILYNEDVKEYISNALAPAKIVNIEINEEEKLASVIVTEDQFSLAIGKAGQNVRLAAKLTGWKINIKNDKEKEEVDVENKKDEVVENVEEIKEEVVSVEDDNKETAKIEKPKKVKKVKDKE